jgi:hypothetical protein
MVDIIVVEYLFKYNFVVDFSKEHLYRSFGIDEEVVDWGRDDLILEVMHYAALLPYGLRHALNAFRRQVDIYHWEAKTHSFEEIKATLKDLGTAFEA